MIILKWLKRTIAEEPTMSDRWLNQSKIIQKDAIIIDDKNVDNEYIHAVRCIEDAKEIFKW